MDRKEMIKKECDKLIEARSKFLEYLDEMFQRIAQD